jgi:hypothetical protein
MLQTRKQRNLPTLEQQGKHQRGVAAGSLTIARNVQARRRVQNSGAGARGLSEVTMVAVYSATAATPNDIWHTRSKSTMIADYQYNIRPNCL